MKDAGLKKATLSESTYIKLKRRPLILGLEVRIVALEDRGVTWQ